MCETEPVVTSQLQEAQIATLLDAAEGWELYLQVLL